MASIHDLIPWREQGASRLTGFDTMRQLQREMDAIFGDFFPAAADRGEARTPTTSFAPRLDIAETETSYHLSAELPGVEEKNVELSLDEGILTIRGTKEAEKKEEGKTFHRVERSYGSFQRAISLPKEVDEDKISARFANGVLEIDIPKSAKKQEKTRKISIKSA